MGIYINKGNSGFRQCRNGEYVDKSGLIGVVNRTLFSERKFTCVTRCRRFGKSMAAKMLAAYYDRSCQSRELFADLQIASDATFEEHLNKYPVISIDLSDFVTRMMGRDIVKHINATLMREVHETYPDVPMLDDDDLMELLIRINLKTGDTFVFIIDEWDAILRESAQSSDPAVRQASALVVNEFVNWLRRMFKGGSSAQVFAGVYMTGILPIKKYKTESAMNNFVEYSMVKPGRMASFFGFTKDEVRMLADKHHMPFDELEKWYDGYHIGDEPSMFNPNSVMMALRSRRCRSFWAATGAFDSVADYIQMNFEGLKDDIIRMLAGEQSMVDPTGFQNDISEVHSRDDVLTVLIHLGYLSFDWRESTCHIPNHEVALEMANAVKANQWKGVSEALLQSRKLLQATLDADAATVARMVDAAHTEHTSILSYNNENSLACVLAIAYYYAHGDYVFHREYATGRGYADLVLQPRKDVAKPAIVIELKYGHSADEAIRQIRERRYWEKLQDYTAQVLLVGISYDRETKQHDCRIEPLH